MMYRVIEDDGLYLIQKRIVLGLFWIGVGVYFKDKKEAQDYVDKLNNV